MTVSRHWNQCLMGTGSEFRKLSSGDGWWWWWLHTTMNELDATGGTECSTMVCCCLVAQSCPTFCIPWTAARQASLSFTITWSLFKFTFLESVMPSNHLILCHPLLLLPSIFPSIRVYSNELVLHQVAKVLEFQLQHQSFQ